VCYTTPPPESSSSISNDHQQQQITKLPTLREHYEDVENCDEISEGIQNSSSNENEINGNNIIIENKNNSPKTNNSIYSQKQGNIIENSQSPQSNNQFTKNNLNLTQLVRQKSIEQKQQFQSINDSSNQQNDNGGISNNNNNSKQTTKSLLYVAPMQQYSPQQGFNWQVII
jgi:hypothetical protein